MLVARRGRALRRARPTGDAGLHDGLMHDRARIHRLRRPGILVHQPRQQRLVERAPIDADADRLANGMAVSIIIDEIAVLLLAESDIAGIDAVFGQRLGACRMIAQQRMAVIVEVADERHVDAHAVERDRGYAARRRPPRPVDGDAHELRAGAGQLGDLLRRSPRHRRCRYWSSTGRRSGRRRRW